MKKQTTKPAPAFIVVYSHIINPLYGSKYKSMDVVCYDYTGPVLSVVINSYYFNGPVKAQIYPTKKAANQAAAQVKKDFRPYEDFSFQVLPVTENSAVTITDTTIKIN